ncbi:aldehyde dehydrogenase [uncultured Dubosiella sp.]|uniref:aldehyde dehydrogenase n=1 Tax=uncultured Dubosiella sp. TaxID=1937011 RepID=UPI0025963555|nr:aldehyde dehydrogenase [uncultured Dubosiella sp.]
MDANQIKALVQEQKVFFATNATRSIMFRKQMLAKLKTAIRQNESRIIAALYADLNKSRAEAYMSEIGLVYQALTYMEKHIDQLSAPEKVRTPLFLFKAKSEIRHDPYGCVLVVSPWNYPFLLTMQPLIEAMAAGNTVILKPSDYSAHTTAVIASLIEDTFAPAYVAVVTGGRQENEALFHQPFDYIFFTGSPAVGKLCMQAASEHLVPVTLELGGKSPAIVDESANIALAARRIVFGKFLNAGQTCVACDHVYVHESKMPALIQQIIHQLSVQGVTLESIGKIINEKHFERVRAYLNDGKVVWGGHVDEATLKIEPTILLPKEETPVMDEEIFGPILPVLPYENFETLCRQLAQKPHPLAFYLFSRNDDHIRFVKENMPFGGGCINNCVLHLSNENMPFGGLQNSGLGHYHGRYGFQTFTHDKSILSSSDRVDLPFVYGPQKPWKEKVVRLFLK